MSITEIDYKKYEGAKICIKCERVESYPIIKSGLRSTADPDTVLEWKKYEVCRLCKDALRRISLKKRSYLVPIAFLLIATSYPFIFDFNNGMLIDFLVFFLLPLFIAIIVPVSNFFERSKNKRLIARIESKK